MENQKYKPADFVQVEHKVRHQSGEIATIWKNALYVKSQDEGHVVIYSDGTEAVVLSGIRSADNSNQLCWIAMSEQHPPLNEEVLVAIQTEYWSHFSTDTIMTHQNGFVGWAGGNDFDDITHWSKMPNHPAKSYRSIES